MSFKFGFKGLYRVRLSDVFRELTQEEEAPKKKAQQTDRKPASLESREHGVYGLK